MDYSIVECLFFKLSFIDMLKCRGISTAFRDCLSDICQNTCKECDNWGENVNVLNVNKLF